MRFGGRLVCTGWSIGTLCCSPILFGATYEASVDVTEPQVRHIQAWEANCSRSRVGAFRVIQAQRRMETFRGGENDRSGFGQGESYIVNLAGEFSGENKESGISLAAKLLASRPLYRTLALRAAGGVELHLNGKPLFKAEFPATSNGQDVAVPLQLAKGTNELVLSTTRTGNQWYVAAMIVADAACAADSALGGTATPIWPLCVDLNVPIAVDIAGAPDGSLYEIRVATLNDETIHVGECPASGPVPGLRPLPSGAYRVTLRHRSVVRRELVLCGPPLPLVRSLLDDHETRMASSSGTTRACRQWLQTLERGETYRPQTVEWQRKVVWVVDMLQGSWVGPPLHIAAFRSTIDDSIQYYRYCAPRRADHSARMPLVIVVPAITTKSEPFINSPYMSAYDEAMRMASAAGRLGVAVLWLGYRCTPQGAPVEFYHYDEVLADFKKQFDVDDTRLWLMGACTGGRFGLMWAEMNPKRFARIGMYNPIIRGDAGAPPPEGHSSERLRAWELWIEGRDPIKNLPRLASPSITIIHDGNPVHGGDPEGSIIIGQRARELGIPLTMQNRSMPEAEVEGLIGMLDDWVNRGDTDVLGPLPRTAGRPLSFDGSVAAVFSAPFSLIVVRPEDEHQRDGARRVAEAIDAAWRQFCYGECAVREVLQLQTELGRRQNLVVVGTLRSAEIRTLLKTGGVLVTEDLVHINGRSHGLPGLAVEICISHPDNPDARIVVLAADRLDIGTFERYDFALSGWYNYAVRREGLGAVETLDIGLVAMSRMAGLRE